MVEQRPKVTVEAPRWNVLELRRPADHDMRKWFEGRFDRRRTDLCVGKEDKTLLPEDQHVARNPENLDVVLIQSEGGRPQGLANGKVFLTKRTYGRTCRNLL